MRTKVAPSELLLRVLIQHVMYGGLALHSLPKYLHLLLSALLLEVLGVLTSSHSLKFRSNTHRKGSLLINNKLLNTLPF